MDGKCKCGDGLTTAVVIALAIIIIFVAAVAWRRRTGTVAGFGAARLFDAAERGVTPLDGGWDVWQPPKPGDPSLESFHVNTGPSADAMAGDDAPERRSVHAALSRLYSSADVDPLVTGQLYSFSDGVRPVYAQRTSHGDVYGLTEYSSSGAPGDLGVDVGPWGLDEYGGKIVGFDDGLPEPWGFPSTPVRWYGPKQRDYYGVEGPTVYADGLYSLTEPDHDPQVGEETL
jgi:hypothetical protein